MPRRREVPKRQILQDPKFGNQEVSKFVNVLMTSGKKSVAERLIYGAFEILIFDLIFPPTSIIALDILETYCWLPPSTVYHWLVFQDNKEWLLKN